MAIPLSEMRKHLLPELYGAANYNTLAKAFNEFKELEAARIFNEMQLLEANIAKQPQRKVFTWS